LYSPNSILHPKETVEHSSDSSHRFGFWIVVLRTESHSQSNRLSQQSRLDWLSGSSNSTTTHNHKMVSGCSSDSLTGYTSLKGLLKSCLPECIHTSDAITISTLLDYSIRVLSY